MGGVTSSLRPRHRDIHTLDDGEDVDISTHVRLLPIAAVAESGLLEHAPKPTIFPFAQAPAFALISYKQARDLDLGLQRLSVKDVQAACATAQAHGVSHLWIDALCGAPPRSRPGDTGPARYSHERFLANLRQSLEYAKLIIVVGDGGATERASWSTPEYLCRLWTRYELRTALKADKLVPASDEHFEALVAGHGFGVRSTLLFADVTKRVPPALTRYPNLVAAADVITLVAVYLASLLSCLTLYVMITDRDEYLSSSEVLAALELIALVVPVFAGPLGLRLFVLRTFRFALNETAQVHSLRRALATRNMPAALRLAEADPYRMPSYEPCDRLIVADLMQKKHGDEAAAAKYWAHALLLGLSAHAGLAAITPSGQHTLRAVLEEASTVGNARWAAVLLRHLPHTAKESFARASSAEARARAGTADDLDKLLKRQARDGRSLPAPGEDMDEGWAGRRIELRALDAWGATVYVDMARGFGTIKVGNAMLPVQRSAHAPEWQLEPDAILERFERSPTVMVEHARHGITLLADCFFIAVAALTALTLVDDFIDVRAVEYNTGVFSYDRLAPVIDALLAPCLVCWGLGEASSIALSLAPGAVTHGQGRQLLSRRYHGWGGWFLLIEVDLFVHVVAAVFSGRPGARMGTIVGEAQTDTDVLFEGFWDQVAFVALRVALVGLLFVPSRLVELGRFLTLSPGWRRRGRAGIIAVAMTLANPHYTGRLLSADDELVDPPAAEWAEESSRPASRIRQHAARNGQGNELTASHDVSIGLFPSSDVLPARTLPAKAG